MSAPPHRSASVTRDLLTRLPKAELHCHLDGSLRPETLLELAREQGIRLPHDDAESLRAYMLVADARNLEDYLARFEHTLVVMQTAEAIERIAFELAEDAWREGVWYLEARFCPVLNIRRGLTPEETIRAALRGLARAEREHGIIGRVIVCALRTDPPAVSLDLARLAVRMRDEGVVGFDLAGAERGHPATQHVAAFTYARSNDLACTCHAGEGAGADSVRDAVHGCCVHRIGHGTSLIHDQRLTEYVNDRRIAVEVCLTSNVQTHAVESYAAHPARAYVERGLNVVLGTDNRLMSGISLTDEYWHAATELGLDLPALSRIARNGFESAFLPWPERQRLVARAEREIARLVETGA